MHNYVTPISDIGLCGDGASVDKVIVVLCGSVTFLLQLQLAAHARVAELAYYRADFTPDKLVHGRRTL